MKKFLLICFAVVLAVGSFCGCSPKDKKLNVSLDVWVYYNDVQKAGFDKYVKEFNETVGAEKGIVVTARTESTRTYEYGEALISSARGDLAAKAFPDMFLTYPDVAKAIDKLSKLASLNEYFTSSELSAYVPEFIQEGTFNGSLKTFPIAKSGELLMLNKTDWDLFAADRPAATLEKLKTVEGIIEVSELYYEWSGGKAFYGRDSLANYFIVGAKQLGIDIFESDESGDTIFNADKDVLKKLWKGYCEPFLKGYFMAEASFRTGDLATGVILAGTGSNASTAYTPTQVIISEHEKYDADFIILPAPVFEGSAYAFQQGGNFAVAATNNTNKIKGAVEFLKWFTQPERNLRFTLEASYIPVTKTALDKDAVQRVISENELSVNPFIVESLNASIDMVNEMTMYTNIPFAEGADCRQIFENFLSKETLTQLRKNVLKEAADRGIGHLEALENLEYLSEAAFTKWFDDLCAEINKTLAAS